MRIESEKVTRIGGDALIMAGLGLVLARFMAGDGLELPTGQPTFLDVLLAGGLMLRFVPSLCDLLRVSRPGR